MFKSCLRPLLSGAMLGLMLAFPQNALDAALEALSLFVSGVLPSLFPFTACLTLMTAGRAFPLHALLGLSLLSGSPAGAKILSEAELSPALSRRIARVTGTMSPMFFLGTISRWLQNERAAQLILLCHLLSALVLAIPLLRSLRRTRVRLPYLPVGAALQQSALAMLTVAGCITLGSVGSRITGCLFPHLPALMLTVLQSLTEATAGCKSLIALRPICLLPLLCFFTSFSGLSILLQNAAFWGKRGVTLQNLVISGFLRGGIAFLLCFTILLCLPAHFAV